MLFVCGCRHDPVSRILTVRFCSPSKSERAVLEYRDVDVRLHEEMLTARPHWQRVLDERIAPRHAVRRLGESEWHEPAVRDAVGASRS